MLSRRLRKIALSALLAGTLAPCALANELDDLVDWLDRPAAANAAGRSGAFAADHGANAEDAFADEGPFGLPGHEGFAPDAADGFWGGPSPPYCRACQIPGWSVAPDSTDGGCVSPTWFAAVDYLALNRTSARRVDLSGIVSTFAVVSNTVVPVTRVMMSTRDLDFGFASGARFTLGRFIGTDFLKRVHSWELTYYGFFNYATDYFTTQGSTFFSSSLIQTGNLFSFFGPPGGYQLATQNASVGGFNGATFQSASYSSNFNNLEWNYRVRRTLGRDSLVAQPDGGWKRQCTTGCTPSFLFGLRYASIVEDFAFHSEGLHVRSVNVNQTAVPIESVNARGDYTVHTTNDMFGPQIGGDLVQQFCRFNFGVSGKFALLSNWISQRSLITANDLSTTVNPTSAFGASGQHVAQLWELGFKGNWHARENLNVRVGYDFIFLNQLAQAPQNLIGQLNNPPVVRNNGHTTFHGPSAGLELFW